MSKFVFQDAVAKAKRDYPAETRNITFIDGSAPDAREQVAAWVKKNINTDYMKWVMPNNSKESIIDNIAHSAMKQSFFAMKDPVSQKGLMFFDEKQAQENLPLDRDAKLHYMFNHELGHLVMKDATASDLYNTHKNTPYAFLRGVVTQAVLESENKADSFGALKSYAEGHLDADDLRTIAAGRAQAMIANNMSSHLTAMSLDALSISADMGQFISLKPAEIKAIAAEHARLYCPTPQDMVELHALSRTVADTIKAEQDPMPLVASWVMDTLTKKPDSADEPVNTQSRYIAARLGAKLLSSGDDAALKAIAKSHGKKAEANLRSALKDIAPAGSPQAKLFTPAPKRPS